MLIESLLREQVLHSFPVLFNKDVAPELLQFQKTRKEFEGQLTLLVFPLAKLSGKSPEETAKLIGEKLRAECEWVDAFNVVKGFLNLVVADRYWKNFIQTASSDPNFGFSPKSSKPKVMVEYSSPNTNKPLHLGHLRNNFLGYSVSQILEAHGHEVIKVQIINDRGIHICKSMLAWQRFGNGETPESSGLKGDKLVGKYYVLFDRHYKAEIQSLIEKGLSEEEAKTQAPILLDAQEMLRRWEEGDPEVYALWKAMNAWVYKGFESTYEAMGVRFDKLYYESDTYLIGRDEVIKGLEKGVLFRKEDGSIWCDLTADGLDQKLLLRKDGTAVYMTQDIGTAILRFRDYPGLSAQIYTVGNEQEYHFKVLFLILKKLGFAQAESNFHLSYGMVELPEGKMKSREGTVVDADDLMLEMDAAAEEIAAEQGKLEGIEGEEKQRLFHQVGMAALKYFLLKVDPRKNMLFDPKESIDFNGNTGPFIQYAYVRSRSLQRRFEAEPSYRAPEAYSLLAEENALIVRLHEFPQVIAQAASEYNPSVVAFYAYELTRDFNTFYQHVPVLKEENEAVRAFRVGLAAFAGEVIKKAMGLLGIGVPERM